MNSYSENLHGVTWTQNNNLSRIKILQASMILKKKVTKLTPTTMAMTTLMRFDISWGQTMNSLDRSSNIKVKIFTEACLFR